MEVYGIFFWDSLEMWHIQAGLGGNDAGLQVPYLMEQLLEAEQDTPMTLKKCEISVWSTDACIDTKGEAQLTDLRN